MAVLHVFQSKQACVTPDLTEAGVCKSNGFTPRCPSDVTEPRVRGRRRVRVSKTSGEEQVQEVKSILLLTKAQQKGHGEDLL